jgi:hypothetical protein
VSGTRLKTEHVVVVHCPEGAILHYHVVVLAFFKRLSAPDRRASGKRSLRLSIETWPITWRPIVGPIAVMYEHGRAAGDHIVRVGSARTLLPTSRAGGRNELGLLQKQPTYPIDLQR